MQQKSLESVKEDNEALKKEQLHFVRNVAAIGNCAQRREGIRAAFPDICKCYATQSDLVFRYLEMGGLLMLYS